MAEELDDGEFWLPSEFLTDDDLLPNFKTTPRLGIQNGIGGNCFGDLSSPVESVNGGSTETESDEDDVVARKTEKPCFGSYSLFSSDYMATKEWKMQGSPQSTLFPNWDLLYAAVAELARIKIVESPPPPQPFVKASSAAPFYTLKTHSDAASHLAYLRLQASQRLKQQQMMRSGLHRHAPPHPPLFSFPTHQLRPFSATKTPFLRDNAVKMQRNGTGVFLPKPVSTIVTETKKKQGPF